MPGAGQAHHAVDHATPARSQQDQGHGHAEGLGPVRQGGVVQVVRAGPDVQGDQRPEVHDGQAVGVDRALGLLRYEVVHHPEEAGGQEEAHGVVAVPPLDHRVGGAGVHGVRLEGVYRHFHAVDDVQHGGHEDEGAEEPVAHVDVLGLALHDGAEEDDGVGDPDDSQEDIDRPLQLSVFLGGGVTQRQGDDCQHDYGLPTPEGEGGQTVGYQASLAGALHHVVGSGEQCASAEGEDHRVGMQGTQAAERSPGQVQVEFRPHELCGDEHA
ncbi:hypothetical protein D9M70_497230 [compost metagenome]